MMYKNRTAPTRNKAERIPLNIAKSETSPTAVLQPSEVSALVPKPLQPIRPKKIETYQQQLAISAEKLILSQQDNSAQQENLPALSPENIKIKLHSQQEFQYQQSRLRGLNCTTKIIRDKCGEMRDSRFFRIQKLKEIISYVQKQIDICERDKHLQSQVQFLEKESDNRLARTLSTVQQVSEQLVNKCQFELYRLQQMKDAFRCLKEHTPATYGVLEEEIEQYDIQSSQNYQQQVSKLRNKYCDGMQLTAVPVSKILESFNIQLADSVCTFPKQDNPLSELRDIIVKRVSEKQFDLQAIMASCGELEEKINNFQNRQSGAELGLAQSCQSLQREYEQIQQENELFMKDNIEIAQPKHLTDLQLIQPENTQYVAFGMRGISRPRALTVISQIQVEILKTLLNTINQSNGYPLDMSISKLNLKHDKLVQELQQQRKRPYYIKCCSMYNSSNFQQSLSINKSKHAKRTSEAKDSYQVLAIQDINTQRPEMKRHWPMLKKKTQRQLVEEAEIKRAQMGRAVDFYDDESTM